MAENSLLYHCLCGWQGETLPTGEWDCPQCGNGNEVGATAITIDTPPIWTPPQIVFSRPQQLGALFLPAWWQTIAQQVITGQIIIDPHDLARGLLSSIPVKPIRQSPGRPRGGPFRDRDHCLTWLRDHAASCIKNDWPITMERLGAFGGKSKYLRTDDPANAAKTIRRWCEEFYEIDFERDVKKYRPA